MSEPQAKDIQSTHEAIEQTARLQFGLDETWRLEMMTSTLKPEIETRIEQLDMDDDLDDADRWRQIDYENLPDVPLPRGVLLVSLRQGKGPQSKSHWGFVNTAA